MKKNRSKSYDEKVILLKNFTTVDQLKNKIREQISNHQNRKYSISNNGSYISLYFCNTLHVQKFVHNYKLKYFLYF